MPWFLGGLFLVSAGTMTYEVVLTRLLSTVSWYYLAFVAVSTAMFGMTVGALLVQLLPERFRPEEDGRNRARAALGMGISLPLALLTFLAIPVEVARTVEMLWTLLLFSVVISIPFVFSGIVICLSLTRAP